MGRFEVICHRVWYPPRRREATSPCHSQQDRPQIGGAGVRCHATAFATESSTELSTEASTPASTGPSRSPFHTAEGRVSHRNQERRIFGGFRRVKSAVTIPKVEAAGRCSSVGLGMIT